MAGTGHRPDRLGGHGGDVLVRLTALARRGLLARRPKSVTSGMALGWDTALALAAIELGFPLVAAVPFVGQEARWPQDAQRLYLGILRQAKNVEIVCEGGYAAYKMHSRNRWMVDNCDRVLALYDGSPDGGTARCVDYARIVGRPVDNLWDEWIRA